MDFCVEGEPLNQCLQATLGVDAGALVLVPLLVLLAFVLIGGGSKSQTDYDDHEGGNPMKYLAIGALLLTVLCGAVLILPSLGVVLAGQQATNQMAVQVQNQATRESDPGAGDGSTGYVSEDALESILEDQQGHSERMADKIVQVAVSGDVAQTATALSGDWSTFGIFAAIVIGGLLFLFVLGSRGGGQEGQR